MLNNASEAHASRLLSIADQAMAEWSLVRNIDETALHRETLTGYAVSYALIRVGNVVVRYSRFLEQSHPDYDWLFWVNLRNRLAHQPDDDPPVGMDEVWAAASQFLPHLIQAITGRPPLALDTA